MNEYLGLYDQEWIELHVVKIKDNTEQGAYDKFVNYLKSKIHNGILIENKIYVIPLFAIDKI